MQRAREALSAFSTSAASFIASTPAPQQRLLFSWQTPPPSHVQLSPHTRSTVSAGGFRVRDFISLPTFLVRQILRDRGFPGLEPDYADRKGWITAVLHGGTHLMVESICAESAFQVPARAVQRFSASRAASISGWDGG